MYIILENFFNSAGDATALYPNGAGYVYPTDLVFNNNICKKTLVWGGSIFNVTTMYSMVQ